MNFQIPVRVYIEDTDAGGIVYYVNYLKFMERARTEHLRSLGQDCAAISGGMLYVVRSLDMRYHRPAALDDTLAVGADVQRMGRCSIDYRQEIWRADELLARANFCIACVDAKLRKPAPLPPQLRTKIQESLDAR